MGKYFSASLPQIQSLVVYLASLSSRNLVCNETRYLYNIVRTITRGTWLYMPTLHIALVHHTLGLALSKTISLYYCVHLSTLTSIYEH